MAKRDDDVLSEEAEQAARPKKLSRDEIRASIFSSEYSVPKVERIDFNGVQIELRQPLVKGFMDQQGGENREFFARFLIDNAYIPETDEKVFDVADRDVLLEMPMNSSWSRAVQAIQVLIDIKVDDKVKN